MASNNHNLIIETMSTADISDNTLEMNGITSEMPLSPASVCAYKKNQSDYREDDDEYDDGNDSSESDSDNINTKSITADNASTSYKNDEDDVDVTHLDPRLEALDGTTKLKAAQEDDDDDDEGQDYSNEEDDGPLDNVAELSLNAKEGDFYQDPTQGLEEPLQEPVKPHIALPCYIETATNPPRTRITLKYAGKPNNSSTVNSAGNSSTSLVSTRGRKNYMVATDLSGESWHATEWAISTILRTGDEMNVVTIVEDDKSGVQTEMREDAEKLTKNIHEQLEHTSLKDITVVIHIIAATKSMGAKELLIEMIDDLDDLSTVIVGSRGRGAIKGLLLGSISNFLVHNSSVPVMVVRAPKKPKSKKKARRSRMVEQTRSVREANMKYESFADDE
ncbi:hypothetical protein BGZ93_001654 [Podila epicladia]|nr:hypothetical protein BGZ92_008256 [Podila epicladia]KAG0097909.1 hypothetical protein BGZ93_001654 [Podila epicladia]